MGDWEHTNNPDCGDVPDLVSRSFSMYLDDWILPISGETAVHLQYKLGFLSFCHAV